MNNLILVEKNETYKILSRVVEGSVEIFIKEQESPKIYKSTLIKNSARKQFYIENKTLQFDLTKELTLKIIVDKKLYFIKTKLKRASMQFYFDNFENMYELVRRKKPRFLIPEHWAQSAKVHSLTSSADIKSPCTILDFSKTGIRLHVRADLPRFTKNEVINLYFKIYRRAEVVIKAKIIYLIGNPGGGGPIIGLEFADSSILLTNKIQNICDDLAFYWAAEAELHKKNL